MEKLSSERTAFYKTQFPALSGAVLLGCLALVVVRGGLQDNIGLIVGGLGMLAVGVAVHRTFLLPLADEVHADNDGLRIVRGASSEIVRYSEMDDVVQTSGKPPQLAIMLREPSRMGGKITFIPSNEKDLAQVDATAGILRASVRLARQRD